MREQAAGALAMLKSMERPSPQLVLAMEQEYSAKVKHFDPFIGMKVTEYEKFSLHAAKLKGLPFTILWRCVLAVRAGAWYHCT